MESKWAKRKSDIHGKEGREREREREEKSALRESPVCLVVSLCRIYEL